MMESMTDIEKIITYNKEFSAKPNIIALGELSGFPNPLTGKIETYMDKLKHELTIQYGLGTRHCPLDSSQFYDFQSLFFQKSYFIESLLKQNPTVEEVYRLLRNSVDATKGQSFLTNVGVRNSLKERYPIPNTEQSIHDIFKTSKGTIVLRSSLSNDISYKIQENVLSVLGIKGRRHAASVIQERKDEMIAEIIEDIVRTYHLIYALDPNVCIIEVGITIPKIFQMLGKMKNMEIINNCLLDLIDAVKYALKQEDVEYVTGTTVESNSLSSGQYKLYSEILLALAKKSPYRIEHSVPEEIKESFQYQGLKGMMVQEEELAKTYAKLYLQTKDKMYSNLFKEHNLASSCYQKTIGQREY